MTRKEAIELEKTKFYEKLTDYEIVKFQLFEDKLCMPIGVYQKALEKVLGHAVFTHDFGSITKTHELRKEFEQMKGAKND